MLSTLGRDGGGVGEERQINHLSNSGAHVGFVCLCSSPAHESAPAQQTVNEHCN